MPTLLRLHPEQHTIIPSHWTRYYLLELLQPVSPLELHHGLAVGRTQLSAMTLVQALESREEWRRMVSDVGIRLTCSTATAWWNSGQRSKPITSHSRAIIA